MIHSGKLRPYPQALDYAVKSVIGLAPVQHFEAGKIENENSIKKVKIYNNLRMKRTKFKEPVNGLAGIRNMTLNLRNKIKFVQTS